MRVSSGMVAAAFAAVLGVTMAHAQQTAAPSAATVNGVPAAAQNGQAAPPRCDANCVRENAAKAAEACAPKIEAQAPTDFDWITRPNPGIFQQADASSPTDSIVRYRGDSVRFMSGDKTWVRVSYECGYDVSKQAVSYAQVRSGRLDQPLAPVPAQNQGKPVVSTVGPVQTAAATPSGPAAAPVPAAHPVRPRIWEPSPIVIQQQTPNPKPH